MREPSPLSAAAGSPLPAAFYRVFRERSPALLALLQVAFGSKRESGLAFVPSGSTGLLTADGEEFLVRGDQNG